MVHKFDKIRRLRKDEGASFSDDEMVIIQEKIDGANFRVWRDETGLRFGSRQVEFLPDSHPECGYGNFTKVVEYIKSLNTDTYIIEGYIYYFEAMIKHTLNYQFDEHPAAVLLDVYDVENDIFWNITPSCDHCAGGLGCLIAPIIFDGKYSDWDGIIPQSKFGNVQAEGVVIKPLVHSRDSLGNRHAAKIVTEQFREEKREVFGDANDWESSFVNNYCTQGRINKHIKQLEMAKNETVQPAWIPILSYNIAYDIVTEEFKKLLKRKTPDLQLIRKECERQIKLQLSQMGVL